MKKLLLLPFIFILTACPKGEDYQAPFVEDCAILTKYSPEVGKDTGTCFCVNLNFDKKGKYFDNAFLPYVEKVMSNHPLRQRVLDYLIENRSSIIQHQEYELPLHYCRGYSATSPKDREKLVKWAEDNRVNRIKCELGRK